MIINVYIIKNSIVSEKVVNILLILYSIIIHIDIVHYFNYIKNVFFFFFFLYYA